MNGAIFLQKISCRSRNHCLLKLADKTSNLRTLVTRPAQDRSVRRKIEYIEWACKVAARLPRQPQ